jgi:hypothetical protein
MMSEMTGLHIEYIVYERTKSTTSNYLMQQVAHSFGSEGDGRRLHRLFPQIRASVHLSG